MKTDFEIGMEIQGFNDRMPDEEICAGVRAAGGAREFLESLNLSKEAKLILLHKFDAYEQTVH